MESFWDKCPSEHQKEKYLKIIKSVLQKKKLSFLLI